MEEVRSSGCLHPCIRAEWVESYYLWALNEVGLHSGQLRLSIPICSTIFTSFFFLNIHIKKYA